MCIEATKPEQKSPKSVQKFTNEIRTGNTQTGHREHETLNKAQEIPEPIISGDHLP